MLTLNNHYSSTIRAFQGGLSRLQVLAKFLRITTALYKIGHCTSWLLTCCHYTTPLHQHLPLHLPGLCHDLLEVSAVHPKSTRSHLVRHSTPRPTRVSVSRATSAPSVTSKSKCSGFGVITWWSVTVPSYLKCFVLRSTDLITYGTNLTGTGSSSYGVCGLSQILGPRGSIRVVELPPCCNLVELPPMVVVLDLQTSSNNILSPPTGATYVVLDRWSCRLRSRTRPGPEACPRTWPGAENGRRYVTFERLPSFTQNLPKG